MTQTYNISTAGFQVVPTSGEPPKPTPSGLIVTRAVETKGGWVGQVIIDKDIVWESKPFTTEADDEESPSAAAQKAANERVVNTIKTLFTGGTA
jgi:hypothetical protein